MSETEKAMAHQPELLGLDWQKRLSTQVKKQLKGINQVTWVGTGSSYHCALWAHWLALSSGQSKITSQALSTWDLLSGFSLNKNFFPKSKKRLFVLISHRGNKGLTEIALKSLKGQKHILIAAEDAPAANHPLIPTSPPEISNAHTMSLVAAMGAASEVIAMLLGSSWAKRMRSDRKKTSELLFEVVSNQDLDPLLKKLGTLSTGLHFVGGGPAHAIALELALKAREMAYIPAHAYNTEELLHGPLTSIEAKDVLVLLPPLSKLSSGIAQKLFHDRIEACRKAAEALGATVLIPNSDRTVQAAASKLGLPWQALLQLVWGQIFCLACAKQKKANPDWNRRNDPRYEEAHQLSQL